MDNKKYMNENIEKKLKELARTVRELQEDFDTGDVVSPSGNDGVGVVSAEMRSNFKFPTDEGSGDENTTDIEAGRDNPAYVVGFIGESGVYRASDLEAASEQDGPADMGDAENAEATTSHVDFEKSEWPEGWTQKSLLGFWSSIGGSVDEAVNKLEDEEGFNRDRAVRLAAEMKSQVIGTDRWRNRF